MGRLRICTRVPSVMAEPIVARRSSFYEADTPRIEEFITPEAPPREVTTGPNMDPIRPPDRKSDMLLSGTFWNNTIMALARYMKGYGAVR